MEETNYFKFADKIAIHMLFISDIRLAIIYFLYLESPKAFAVYQISEKLNIVHTVVQAQMHKLLESGIVTRTRLGITYYYTLDKERLFELLDELKVERK